MNEAAEFRKRSMTMATVKVNGVRLFYELNGTGDIPLVLVHGSWDSHHDWDLGLVAPRVTGRGASSLVDDDKHLVGMTVGVARPRPSSRMRISDRTALSSGSV